ncbi:glycosyltransferase family 4 protein [Piscinibacter terrae]|uniref:Glycosyltransferase WbuB n=1 Tax=Piscinibacter terrae TaxID=2496871 RepID=A0A3N7HHV4_9BURK|nr:glycosyltransferase family 4 protein [Albitalea terrae]RQP21608.1 glycosyltransferase WbuB [Albitalea terrae]
MHILFLTDNFPPEVNAPASRTHEHCRQWVAAGEKVTVITCAPNFPKGRVFDGYRNRLWQREVIDGIEVIRVWSYITANEGFARRVLDYMSFMLSAFVASWFVRRVDVVVGTSPQFFTAVAGWAVGAVKRIPFVFELRDLWPESIKAVGAMQDSATIRWLERLELFLYRRASLIVSVTHAFRETLARRGIDPNKVEVVTNGVDISRFSPRPKDAELEKSLGLQGCFVAGYIGTHGMAHALETLLDAAALLRDHPQGSNVRILLLGDGARKDELKAAAQRMGLPNVLFIDSVSKDEVARYWSLLDVSIIHLRRTELFTTVIPSKLFECMGMGIPVLHGVQGESAAIVEREGAGIVFEPENAQALSRELLHIRDDNALRDGLRQRALAAASHYDRQTLALKMLQALRRLLAH